VYWWRLILEEYGPEIVFIKGIHNTIADAISQLEYASPDAPSTDATMHQNWMTFSKCWCKYTLLPHNDSTNNHNYSMNSVFANCSKEEEIFPLTVREIAEAQGLDKLFKATALKKSMKRFSLETHQCSVKTGN
jgi:hypothetical protein